MSEPTQADQIQPENPEVLLAHLKLSLISILPNAARMLQTASDTNMNPDFLVSLYGFNKDSYVALADHIVVKIDAHQFMQSTELVRFCFEQLTAISRMRYCLLQLGENVVNPNTNQALTGRMDNSIKAVQDTLSLQYHANASGGFHLLWRLLYTLDQQPSIKPWWKDDFLAPTRSDIDIYIKYLLHLVNIEPADKA